MSERDDGGPAFPHGSYAYGMSLRDWFAGQAVNSFASSEKWPVEMSVEQTAAAIAIGSYAVADAMLLERAK